MSSTTYSTGPTEFTEAELEYCPMISGMHEDTENNGEQPEENKSFRKFTIFTVEGNEHPQKRSSASIPVFHFVLKPLLVVRLFTADLSCSGRAVPWQDGHGLKDGRSGRGGHGSRRWVTYRSARLGSAALAARSEAGRSPAWRSGAAQPRGGPALCGGPAVLPASRRTCGRAAAAAGPAGHLRPPSSPGTGGTATERGAAGSAPAAPGPQSSGPSSPPRTAQAAGGQRREGTRACSRACQPILPAACPAVQGARCAPAAPGEVGGSTREPGLLPPPRPRPECLMPKS
uniref:collagen alpha-2(I) chain-like n=1 Tax=Lonchura striata TaxID=40157 RepID=UPI000B4C2BA6|nr:collagen alpha-2(I) chain-like [Lonchura striata domestica]